MARRLTREGLRRLVLSEIRQLREYKHDSNPQVASLASELYSTMQGGTETSDPEQFEEFYAELLTLMDRYSN